MQQFIEILVNIAVTICDNKLDIISKYLQHNLSI